jgi:hypothetical protein
MRAYGVPASMKGTQPWARTRKRFAEAHNYWVTTVHPDGRPNSSAVWGLWLDGAFWFSCSPGSRKAKNLSLNPECTVTTDDAEQAVILEGRALQVQGPARLLPFVRAYKKKYDWDMDPASPGYFIVTPRVAFAFTEDADVFARSATKYVFPPTPRKKTSKAR